MYAKFIIKRAFQSVLTVFGAITLIFLLRFLAPGSVIDTIVSPETGQEARQQMIEDLGLDQPIYVQYMEYIGRLLQGDLGFSYLNRVDVNVLLANRVPATIELAIAATIVATAISIPLGVAAALNRQNKIDYGATLFSLLGISTPNFWLGIMLMLLVAVQFGFLPTSGRNIGLIEGIQMLIVHQTFYGVTEWLRYITLPAITLGTFFTALLTRMTRSEMLEELGSEYVRVLKAKGLPQTLIHFKHVLRNSLIPVVTVLGLQTGYLLSGSVVVETVFSWPGMGDLLISSVNSRDWPVLQGILVVIAIAWVFINTTVDVVYSYLDPRVGLE